MPPSNLVLRTKLIPPRVHKRILIRPRLTERLLEALEYRLAILQAGAGYGKSTALAVLEGCGTPLVWYHLDVTDSDPFVFMLHLIHGFQGRYARLGERSLAVLESWAAQPGSQPHWREIADQLANELCERVQSPLFLVLDDVHYLSASSMCLEILDRLIELAPSDLHTILSTRQAVKLPGLVGWRVRGEVLFIDQAEMAFTPQETADLFFHHYGTQLSAKEVEDLSENTEGWAIALQLYGQQLRSGTQAGLDALIARGLPQPQDLFVYLAHEVLEKQEPALRRFLRETAVMHELSADLCDRVRETSDSEQHIRALVENGLFLIDLGDGHARYHPLFRKFLIQTLDEAEQHAAHRRVAEVYLASGERVKAITHLLVAREFDRAAGVIASLAEFYVQEGRLDTLESWLGDLPPDVMENHPLLLVHMGDIARLRSRFDEAIGWYRQAEERSRQLGNVYSLSHALHGSARVYIDTVNPTQAEHFLEEVLRLTDGFEDRESRARMLELLAENRLNAGKIEEAERYQLQAAQIRETGPSEAELSVRVLLRTGRLNEARRRLENQVASEQREPVLRPRAHRETHLVLALILAFQGESDLAYQYACSGAERGELLNSPFVTAVGYMRQGHARQIQADADSFADAVRCYREAIQVSETLAVPRLKVEAYWGLCRAYGFRGELEAAEREARLGIDLAQRAGDQWIKALTCITMTGGLVLHRRYNESTDWLSQALSAFRACNDPFGETVARMWQCLIWWETGETTRLKLGVEELLRLVSKHHYGYLFTHRTLLGPPDNRRLAPMLVFARDLGCCAPEARDLLNLMGLPGVESHPGYQLRVQTLGRFKLWRGDQEVLPVEWRREKARKLYQLLLTTRKTVLDREQICERLWANLDPETAQRDFKVALNALYRVLEPNHGKDVPSAYIARDGRLYGLRAGADVWIDADEFEKLVVEGDLAYPARPLDSIRLYNAALALYEGEFLQENLYEDWCSEERERLLAIYLRSADRLVRLLADQQRWEDVLVLCQAILQRDNCWEEAYRQMMTAYARVGQRAQALRVWQHCVVCLQNELGTDPCAETTQVYQALLAAADQ